MPTYEFRCPLGHEFERFYRTISTSEAQTACPECGRMAERIMSVGAGLHFKGSGFYLTDYGKDAHKKKPPTDAKSDGAKGDSSSGDSSTSESASSGGDGAAPASGTKGGESAKSDAKPAEPKPAPKPSGSE